MENRLTIDTPEQVALELPVAGIGSRGLAAVVDTLLQGAITLVMLFFSTFAAGITLAYLPGVTAFLPAMVVLVLFLVNWLYFALFEIVGDGKTPGKRIAGIRVIKDTGRPINAYESLTRNIVRVVDFLPAFYGVGVLIMMCNHNSRRLGDFVAGTIVVYDRPQDAIAPLPDPATRVATSGTTRLTLDELALVEAYLSRRFDLDPIVRDQRAEQIVARVTARTGVRPADGQPLDDFLQALARETRDQARFR